MRHPPQKTFNRSDPGVPEALPLALAFLRDRMAPDVLDDLWIFPPLVQGRRERGLLVASAFAGDDRRSVHTVTYLAQRTGEGLAVEPAIREEGVAPPDRLPRLINGVVQRGRHDLGDPRNVRLGGDVSAFEELLAELEAVAAGEALP